MELLASAFPNIYLHNKSYLRLTDNESLPSLASICLSKLAEHLNEYLDALASDYENYSFCLPPHQLSTLVALSKRRGILSNRMLISLSDFTCLDLSNSRSISEHGLMQTLSSCTNLKVLSLDSSSGITVSKGLLIALAACPNLLLLRLGADNLTTEAVEAFPSLLPRIETLYVASSWEELDGDGDERSLDRFGNLKYLVWPDIHSAIEALIRKQCPKIKVNPSTKGQCGDDSLFDPFDSKCALDLPFTTNLPKSSSQWTVRSSNDLVRDVASDTALVSSDDCHKMPLSQHQLGLPHFLSIAEKFRLAYISQAQRAAERQAKAEAVAYRRKLRASVVLRAEEQWLDEV